MMFTRRQFLARTGALAGLAAGGAPLWAATKGSLPDGKASRGMITKEADEAIKHGLKYLAEGQHADGSFGSGFQHGNIAITMTYYANVDDAVMDAVLGGKRNTSRNTGGPEAADAEAAGGATGVADND